MTDDLIKLAERPVVLFTSTRQVESLTLADGFRFVVFTRGSRPVVIPLAEQGVWQIDIPEMLAKGNWPVAVATFDAAHIGAITSMPAEAVDQMLAAALRARGAEQ